MEEKTAAILQAEEVKETAVASDDAWSKFPPQIDDIGQSQAPKASKSLFFVVLILIILAVGVVGFVVYKSDAMNKREIAAVPTSTPATNVSITPIASPTPQITDKSVVKIQILNGSGIIGQAAQVGAALEKDNFKTPDTGNYDGVKKADTVVNYTSTVDKSLVDEVVAVLKKSFGTVNASVSSALTDFDIQIITGTGK